MSDEARAAEKQFYSRYSWCLNPALSVQDLLLRFEEELDRYGTLTGWQREESKANLYLFVCAVACTSDDYFALRWNVAPLSRRLPRLRQMMVLVQWSLNLLQSILRARELTARRWRQRWNTTIEEVCQILVCDSSYELEHLERLRRASSELLHCSLPAGLLRRRMRLPEAFRSQDMAHHDVISLIQKFCDSSEPKDVVVMGLRTAGAYFAPLMAEYLKMRKWPNVSWFSIRPKNGATPWEQRRLRSVARRNCRILVVDDYPASGNTFRLTLQILKSFKIRPDQIAVLAPTHDAQPNWVQLVGFDPVIPVFTIHSSELHKASSMAPGAVEALCGEYYRADGWSEARVLKDAGAAEVNVNLASHSKDGYHVRAKHLVAIELSASGRSPVTRKVLLKSVGWGWLGYHAYIAGTRLRGFVPPVVGLRNGLLLSEWVEGSSCDRQPLPAGAMAKTVAAYVAARSRRLPLTGARDLDSRTYRWTGSDQILDILRAAFGPYTNRLKLPALRRQVQKYISSVPTLVDGKMRPEEWIHTLTAMYKSDFEHHNFGGAEIDVVDPAYDLAAAIFEFRLSKQDERTLLRSYAEQSGDASITERILLHKILYGRAVMDFSMQCAALGKEASKHNERHQCARDFLVFSMNDFCSELLSLPKLKQWYDALFFMDLDGVFDQEVLGFPHATQSGLLSLILLRSHGFSVVSNTGRSVRHVRHYCQAYGLSGGIAEFGAVFVDAVNDREMPLIDKVGAEQLHRCREAIQKMPGVFIDPGYQYSIRAYRYNMHGLEGLKTDEIKDLLKRTGCSNLTYIARSADSYILQKRTSKGTATQFVRKCVGNPAVPITAVGDSPYDIGMLKAADYAYAPGNCSPILRDLAKQGLCRILKQRFQNGLLAAVQHRVAKAGGPSSSDIFKSSFVSDDVNPLMQMVLKAADRRLAAQLLIALSWWSL